MSRRRQPPPASLDREEQPTPAERLRRAVDDLTLPYRSLVLQSDGSGGHRVETVELDSRLSQLFEARYASSDSGAPTGTAPSHSQRMLVDLDAVQMYDEISAGIVRAAKDAGGTFKQGPIATLRHWYVEYMASNPADADIFAALRQLRSWRRRIDQKLDPPKQVTTFTPCPICGEKYAWDRDSGDQIMALVVQYWVVDGAISRPRAVCRFCEAVAYGIQGIKQFADGRLDHVFTSDRDTPGDSGDDERVA